MSKASFYSILLSIAFRIEHLLHPLLLRTPGSQLAQRHAGPLRADGARSVGAVAADGIGLDVTEGVEGGEDLLDALHTLGAALPLEGENRRGRWSTVGVERPVSLTVSEAFEVRIVQAP